MSHKKILFKLEKDAEGYPPANIEGIWGSELGSGEFVIDNIPFFTPSVALGDVVSTQEVMGETYYDSTKRCSGNSLVRVILFRGQNPAPIRAKLGELGCSTEQGHPPSLIAVNVPQSVRIADVRRILDEGCAEGLWDYEEPIVRQ